MNDEAPMEYFSYDALGALLRAAELDQDAIRSAVDALRVTNDLLAQTTKQLPGDVSCKVEAKLSNGAKEAAQEASPISPRRRRRPGTQLSPSIMLRRDRCGDTRSSCSGWGPQESPPLG